MTDENGHDVVTLESYKSKKQQQQEHLAEIKRKYMPDKVEYTYDRIKPEVICFDMEFLRPHQIEALFRLIDGDQDLEHGWVNGPKGTAITVNSKSLMFSMTREEWDAHHSDIIFRVC